MAFKLREDHLITMIDFMEAHPDFATGRLSVANARDKFRSLWQELTQKLNSLGYGSRPVEKWQKTWADYKVNLKKKASEIKRYQEGTGGGPELKKKLSDIEIRVLALMGKTAYEGCGVKEFGLRKNSEDFVKNFNLKNDVRTSLTSFIDLPQSSRTKTVEFTEMSSQMHSNEDLSNKPLTLPVNCLGSLQNKVEKRPLDEFKADHDYLFSPPKRTLDNKSSAKKQKVGDINTIYKETVENLKNIDNTVERELYNIRNTVAEKIDDLKETIRNGFQEINNTLKEFLIQIKDRNS